MAQNLVEYILDIKTKAAEQGLDNVVDALNDVEKELKSTQKETEQTSAKFGKFAKAGMAVGKIGAVMGAVAVAVAAAGAAAFSLAKKISDLTNELNDLSVRSGLATDTISGLRFSLVASGQSAESLNEVLGAVSGQFAQLSTEGSAVEKKFTEFGIAVRNTNGELRSNNDIMLDSINVLQDIEDTSERSRAAVTLFGEAGAKLNQALAAGDFEKFLSFTQKFGVKTGPEASKSAANFQVAISALTLSFNGMLQKFTQSTGLIDKVTNQLINIGSVFAFVGSLIESFSKEIGTMAEAFERDFKIIMDILGVFVDLISETVNSINPMRDAFEEAFADAEEFRSGMEDFKKTLVTVNSASGNTEKAVSNIADAAEKSTEKIRDLNDVFNDLLSNFIRLDLSRILTDIEILTKALTGSLGNGFINLSQQIDKVFTKIGLFGEKKTLVIPIEPQTLADLERINKGIGFEIQTAVGETAKIFDNKIGGVLIKAAQKVKEITDTIAFGLTQGLLENESKIKNKFQEIVKGSSEKGLVGAFQALGKVGKIIAVIGSIFLAGFKIASQLGQRGSTVAEIEKSVEEDIRARAKAIELGLQALPRILFNVLPPLFVEFADRVVFGFFKSIAEFVGILKDFFRSIFTREGRQERREGRRERRDARGEEFRRRLEQLVNIAGFRSGGRFLPSAKGGIKFTGSDQGLAMLHRGEFVVPETGQMPQAVQRTMGMGQGGMTININAAVVESNAIDELVRQIERRFQTFGSSTSPLFGGR